MQRRYTKQQILEAIRHWENVLESMDMQEGKVFKQDFKLRRHDSIKLDIPAHMLPRLIKLMSKWMKLQTILHRDPTNEELAKELGTDVKFVEMLIQRLRYYGLTLNNGSWFFMNKKLPNNKPALDDFMKRAMKSYK